MYAISKLKVKTSKFLFTSILLLLTGFYAVNNYIWIKMNDAVAFSNDESFHTTVFVNEYSAISTIQEFRDIVKKGKYCPLYHCVARIFIKIFGKTLLVLKMANLFWFVISLSGIYFLAREIFDSKTGLWAMSLFSMFPIVYGSSRLFLESFGLMSLISFLFLFLFKLISSRNLLNYIVVGIFLGLSFMTKKSAIVFLGIPLLYTLIILFKSTKNRKFYLVYGFVAGLIFTSIVFYRYFNMFYLSDLVSVPFEEIGYYSNVYNRYFKVFIIGIINYQLSLPFFILFVYGLYKFIKSSIDIHVKINCLLWVFVPIMFFSLIPHRQMLRVIIPVIPAMAIFSAHGLAMVHPDRFRRGLSFILIVIALVQFYDISFLKIVNLEKMTIRIAGMKQAYFNFYYPDSQNVFSLKDRYLNARPEEVGYYSEVYQLIIKSDEQIPYILVMGDRLNIWYNFFQFKNTSMKLFHIDYDNNFSDKFTESVMAMKQADFILCNEKINVSFQTYVDRLFNWEHLRRKPGFSENDYMLLVEDLQIESSFFKLIKEINSREGVRYLYKRSRIKKCFSQDYT